MQNQHTRELISARKTSHKHNNKDLSRLREVRQAEVHPQNEAVPLVFEAVPLVFEDVPLVEVMYLVFARMPCESYRSRLGSLLLCLCDVFGALINSLVC